MGCSPPYRRGSCLLAVFLLLAVPGLAVPGPAMAQADTAQPASADPAAVEQYRRALAVYEEAHAPYAAAANSYWHDIAAKRKLRNAKRAGGEPLSIDDYVLTQPPVYSGPPKPRNPLAPPSPPTYVPVVADFISAASREFDFAPQMPPSEEAFKRAYARVALAAGLTPGQIVRIYSFEATGNGSYDVEAGREFNKHARAITTALGYNQLLATNTVELVAEDGNRFVADLQNRAARLGPDQQRVLARKIEILRRMIAFARSVPDAWGEHERLANTEKGLAVHALNLDLDVGPLLQTQKLVDSVVFARRKGVTRVLSAAELEMMNLTGDGNGFDMVTMPEEWRDRVPTSNFFQPGGYADNPVVQRNNVVSRLLAATNARMDEECRKPGAEALAALLH